MDGRAELKVESGKLLRADVSYGDRIEHVSLHGDFFVYPEEGLDTVEDALDGADAAADEQELADRVRQAVDADTRLVGFDAADVARVVREAVRDGE
ncbi:MAG: biotin--protein ligase [Candidatus Nanohaloarchaea archaeon]|nr:biotin--protein ligase [Candidatus Nanohaloarchaea archaeon]